MVWTPPQGCRHRAHRRRYAGAHRRVGQRRHRRIARGGDLSFEGKGEGGGQFTNREGLEFRRKSAALKSFCVCYGCWDLSRLFSPLRLFHMAASSCTVPITAVSSEEISNRHFNSIHRLLFPALFVKRLADSYCLNRSFRCRFLING